MAKQKKNNHLDILPVPHEAITEVQCEEEFVELLRHADDQPSIGLILCKEGNLLVVEYALRNSTKPMGVATYRVVPRKLKGELPTAKQIEKVIGKARHDEK